MLREVIRCRGGHENVRATHKSTLEFTKEDYLTPRGDCILCVGGADRGGINDLSDEFKAALKAGRKVLIRIRVGDLVDEVIAEGGSPGGLILKHDYSMVIRKSGYIDARTSR